DCRWADRDQDVDAMVYQVSRETGKLVKLAFGEPLLDNEVLPFDVAEFSESAGHEGRSRRDRWRWTRPGTQHTEAVRLCRPELLRFGVDLIHHERHEDRHHEDRRSAWLELRVERIHGVSSQHFRPPALSAVPRRDAQRVNRF